MPAETPDLGELLAEAADFTRGMINVALPATVLAYDPARQTVTVKPSVSARVQEPNTGALVPVPIPAISNVPVAFPSAAGFSITWPLTIGDPVTLVFCDRSTDEWKSTGLPENVPLDVRRHDFTDAVAIPGGRPFPQALTADSYTPTGLVIKGLDIRLGSSAAVDFVALASLVLAELTAIKATFDAHVHTDSSPALTTPPTVPMAAPGSVAATKVKAE